ncbi:hypothetical protein [Sphingomonas oryzagri]
MSAIMSWLLAHALTAGLSALLPGAGIVLLAVRYGADVLKWLSTHRQDAVMLLLAGIAAGIYAWGAIGRHDRDAIVAWGNQVCASAGADFAPQKGKRGQACAADIAQLARDRLATARQSAQVLAKAQTDHDAREVADAAQRSTGTAAIAGAATNMEKVNAQVGPDDHVDGAWFAALNRAGGLRPAR